MEKINSVYAVENKIGGGMKNIERSKKEVNALHGEVSVFELNKPHSYEEFETWPDDIKREYLKKLCWTHGATQQKAADMLGVDPVRLQYIVKTLCVPWRHKGDAIRHKRENDAKWDAFIRGKTLLKDMIPADTFKALAELKENLAETEETQNETPALTPAQTEETAQKLETFKNEKPVLMPAPPETHTDINLMHISTIANAMYHIAHISDESLRSALAAEFAYWIWTNDAEHLNEDMTNIRRRILRDVGGGKA